MTRVLQGSTNTQLSAQEEIKAQFVITEEASRPSMTGHVTEHELPEEATQPKEEPPADCCNQGEVEVER